ncbi:MAG: hypothetical protein QXU40_02190 [Candidatus Pacearchaeota archaeon]
MIKNKKPFIDLHILGEIISNETGKLKLLRNIFRELSKIIISMNQDLFIIKTLVLLAF